MQMRELLESKTIRFLLKGFLVVIFCLRAFAAGGGEPTEQVKETADQILSVLRDPKWGSSDQHQSQIDIIQGLISRRFDWEAISQGCLGRHWRNRSSTEKRQFQVLLEDFLRRNYVEQVTSSYTNLVEVQYLSERVIGDYASVRTKVITQKTDASVEYRLRKRKGGSGWKVYDALIEGVSLVKNYRVQFDEIIRKSSYEELVKRIKRRIQDGVAADLPF